LLVVLFLVSLFSIAMIWLLDPAWERQVTNYNHETTEITIVRPGMVTLALCAGLVIAIAMVSIRRCVRRRLAIGAIMLVMLGLVAVPASALALWMLNPVFWTTTGQLPGPDGRTYYFLDFSFLQGQEMALTYLEHEGWLTRTMRSLGTNNGDCPRSWASVVRPAGARDDYGQLYSSESGMILGIRYKNHCYLAYNTKTGEFFGHGDIEELSPFVLIGPDTPIHQPDVMEVIEQVRWGAEFFSGAPDIRSPARYLGGHTLPGYPRERTLTAALTHANPAVRDAAERILEVHKTGKEKAAVRVAERVKNLIARLASKDSKVRGAAADALGSIGPAAEVAVAALIEAMKDNNGNVRYFVARALGKIGPRAQAAIPTLMEALRDKDGGVRRSAANALKQIGSCTYPKTRPA